ncbi:CIC11C00000004453 [Sungouiella intermedia]|uniref:CIC11C00000004453 n=1 Tax=Sungouiella intermedia TaxID=45354 RepID=A0A1L0DGG2_9ASCO|nr:CIC11C00000004453 [[Candida] intermedia]
MSYEARTRSSSEANRRHSGQHRRALSNLPTNLVASRVAKRDDDRRKRLNVRDQGRENDPEARVSFGSSEITQPLSDDGLIRHHFDRINLEVGELGVDGTDSENASPQVFSDALSTRPTAEEDEQEEEEEEEDDEAEEEEDVEDDENDPADLLCPQEPKWSRAIFNELQHVMRKYSTTTLDEKDEDTYDVTMVAEYAPEIFNYLHELEHRLSPDPNYMDNQDELRWEMRSVLVDWVVQVHQRFNLLPETLFLTINYIDRFLSRRRVSLSRFQLVGAVALFIAAKFEEINCPTVREVAYMADNAYSVEDFLKAERFMIDVLEFDMGWPGPMSFLRRTSKADDYDYETRTLAKYFLEVTIMDSRFVASQPSWLAAGAHYLLRKMLNKGPWTELHVFYSGYTEEQLRPLARIYMEICQNAEQNHRAIFEKYQERRYRRSSLFVQEFLRAMRQSTRD